MKLLFAAWRDRVRARLIEDLKGAARLWSVQLAGLGTLLWGFVLAFPGLAAEVWSALPADMRASMPPELVKAATFALFAATLASRVVKQKVASDGK